jgi:vacuolar-type H+-ATPase subunit D/Vma8
MKVTNRRVNALENVTIPKIQVVLDYIERELDELEREGKCYRQTKSIPMSINTIPMPISMPKEV